MMNKIHIDSIQDPSAIKTANIVGPGQHEMDFSWILPKDSLRNKTGPQFSFTRSTKIEADHFEK